MGKDLWMRSLILIVCCLNISLASASLLAQDAHLDSLRQLLDATAADYDEQIRLLGELSDRYSYTDSARAMDYALQIRKLAENRNDQRGAGIAHYRIGGVYFELNHIDSAINHYEIARRLLENDTSFLAQQTLAKVWYNLGAQYQRKGDEDTFLDMILNQSTPIYERIGDSLGMGRNFHNIGLIFQNILEYNRAAFYYRKAIAMLEKYPSTPELTDSYTKLAEAIIYTDSSDTGRRAIALDALERADSLLHLYPDTYSRILYLNSLGMFEEIFEGQLEKALEHYLYGYELAREAAIYRLCTLLLNRAYYIYDKQEKHQLALQTVQRISEYYHAYLSPRGRLLQLRHMAHSLEQLGDINEAYRMQKMYTALNDSLHAEELAFKVHHLEQRFEAKEKEAQIVRLNQQMQVKELSAQRNKLWAILLGGAILLLAGILLAGYNIFHERQLIARQHAELLEQRMEKMNREQHISVFAAMLEGQEQERKRLAIDLHDGLGGTLSAIKLRLSKVAKASNGSGEELSGITRQLDASVDELRHIARNLMPETLLKYGLSVALRDFCKGLEQEDTRISFQSYGLHKDIPNAVQIMVYRIVQELITNAAKHARATYILAQCLQNGNHLSITVEDDGIGLLIKDGQSTGMGLANVKNRVAYLGGRLDIHAEAGVGTTVNIELTYADEPYTN